LGRIGIGQTQIAGLHARPPSPDPSVSQAWAETVAGLLPAGRLVGTAARAHTLIDQLVEVSLLFLQRHLHRRADTHPRQPQPNPQNTNSWT
jgi:hypothetical protein